MQYFKPAQPELSVGDCMPFYHDGAFHLFYLLDEGHHNHPLAGALGGHQWAHASSRDLCEWTHHPLALPLDFATEGGNCTGSLLVHENKWYAFYSLRPYPNGGEFFKIAESNDGVNFIKDSNQAGMAPPTGYGEAFRDPCVFRAQDGLFHMIITTTKYENCFNFGCLGHFTSENLKDWALCEPLMKFKNSPECPDYFEWNGWYYILCSLGGTTCYRMSKNPFGPWIVPKQDVPASSLARVMKTAAWKNNRRIGAAWLPPRDMDNNLLFAGKAVFREMIQNADGTLGAAFPVEMQPVGRTEPIVPQFSQVSKGAQQAAGTVILNAANSFETAFLDNLPENYRLTARVSQQMPAQNFGFFFGSAGNYSSGIEFSPAAKTVTLAPDARIEQVKELGNAEFKLEMFAMDDLLDVCIDGQRTVINSLQTNCGEALIAYAENGKVKFEDLKIYPL